MNFQIFWYWERRCSCVYVDIWLRLEAPIYVEMKEEKNVRGKDRDKRWDIRGNSTASIEHSM